MNIIIINQNSYYLSTELFEHNKNLFNGCKGRDVIKKKKLNPNDYIYAHLTKSGWKISNEDYKVAKVLITKNWYDQKINIQINNEFVHNTPTNGFANNDYQMAPPILDIEDYEKFKDTDGHIINIIIRGERNYKKCYFRVKDVSKGFNMPNLQKTIIDERKSYELDKHYKKFIIISGANGANDANENEIYLTYKGMIKVLFCSRSGNAESFQDWATETLFTVQMGTEDSKHELVKSMFGGASIGAIKEAFKVSSEKTPLNAKDLNHDLDLLH
jgi:protein involved in ribonucleotide reduction